MTGFEPLDTAFDLNDVVSERAVTFGQELDLTLQVLGDDVEVLTGPDAFRNDQRLELLKSGIPFDELAIDSIESGIHPIEAAIDSIESGIHPIEAAIDSVEPPIHLFQPAVHLIEATINLAEAHVQIDVIHATC